MRASDAIKQVILLCLTCQHFSDQRTSAQDDPLCNKIRANELSKAPPIPIRLEIEEGESFEAKCKFCSDSRDDPVNWFFRQRLSRINIRKIYVEVDGPELEVTADPFTFDEFNRVFVEKDNSLKIRKFNFSDVGTYYCKRFRTGQHSGFEYKPQLLLRREPLVVPLNKNFVNSGQASMNLTRDYNGQDSQGQAYAVKLNHLRVAFEPGNWSECSTCGEAEGEQERQSECRVKFSFPHGESMPKFSEFIRGKTIGERERSNLETAIFQPYRTLMQDYDELMTAEAITRTCHEKAAAKLENYDSCQRSQREADLGYVVGMGCRSYLFINRWEDFARRNGLIFPPPEVLGGLIESRSCRVNCTLETGARSMGAKAKKLLKQKGLNLLKILRKQKKRKARKPKRHVISEYEGTSVKFSCPGAKLDHLLLWKNGTLDLNPFLVATETDGRISYINHLVLHIKNLTKYDSQIYSCWQNNDLHGEVEIKVVKPKEAPPDIHVALIYLAVGTICDLLIFLALMVVRHRQRKAVRMKGYKELYEDSSELNGIEMTSKK